MSRAIYPEPTGSLYSYKRPTLIRSESLPAGTGSALSYRSPGDDHIARPRRRAVRGRGAVSVDPIVTVLSELRPAANPVRSCRTYRSLSMHADHESPLQPTVETDGSDRPTNRRRRRDDVQAKSMGWGSLQGEIVGVADQLESSVKAHGSQCHGPRICARHLQVCFAPARRWS